MIKVSSFVKPKAVVKALKAPSIPDWRVLQKEQEEVLSHKLLGVKARPGRNGVAIVKAYKSVGSEAGNSISIHKSKVFTDGNPVDFMDTFSYAYEATFLIRSIQESSDAFIKHIEKQKSRCKNDARCEFLDNLRDIWALPTRNYDVSGHDLLMWGDTDAFVSEDGSRGAGLHGSVVSYMQLGSVIRSVIYGYPMDTTDISEDRGSGKMNPIWYASPRDVLWRWQYYILPDIEKAYGFWSGVVTPDKLVSLLEYGDLLLKAESVNRKLYLNAVLRVCVPVVDGKADFSRHARNIAKLGKWERLYGNDIRSAFKSFIPGSTQRVPWNGHCVETPKEVFNTIGHSLKFIGDRDGTVMMGNVDKQPLFVDPKLRNGSVYIGPTGCGKTTLATAHALQEENIVFYPLTAAEFDSAPSWCKKFGGSVIDLDLPDAYTVLKEKNPNYKAKKDEVVKLQEDLHIQDRQFAVDLVTEYEKDWKAKGMLTGLPLTFKILSGDTVRLLNFYDHFIAEWAKIWGNRYKNYGDRMVAIFDNFSGLRLAEDPILGSMPVDVGKNLGLTIAWYFSNGRNRGISPRVLTQAEEDLDYVSTAIMKQAALVVSMDLNNHTMVNLYQPRERTILSPNLYVRLPEIIETEIKQQIVQV